MNEGLLAILLFLLMMTVWNSWVIQGMKDRISHLEFQNKKSIEHHEVLQKYLEAVEEQMEKFEKQLKRVSIR